MHWTEKYLGQPWTQQKDCFYYFRKIQEEVFGRDLPTVFANHNVLALSAARIMVNPKTVDNFGCFVTSSPREGDAVFLMQRTRPHHIGVVAFTSPLSIIHALEGIGVVVSDKMDLLLNGWKVGEFLTWK